MFKKVSGNYIYFKYIYIIFNLKFLFLVLIIFELINVDHYVKGSSFVRRTYDNFKCTSQTYNKTCCNSHEFQCNSGECIPQEFVCSSPADKLKSYNDYLFSECSDSSDEFGCSYKPCASRSSKCFGSCDDLSQNRSRCSCNKGFILESSSFDQKCIDVDECKLGVDWCSQNCINLRGSFTCKCQEGYAKDKNGFPGACKAKERKITFLFNTYPWIYGQDLDEISPLQEMIPSGHIDGVDVDFTTDIVYWTYRSRLNRSYLPRAKGKKITVGHPQNIPLSRRMRRVFKKGSGFSIDWAGGNIYWLTLNGRDLENRAIIVTKLDGRYHKIIMNGVWHATSLLVHPQKGIMYWTWLRTKEDSGISTAWMNGRYRKALLRLPGQDPVSLTLDHQSDGRFYWIDAITNTIYYAVHNPNTQSLLPVAISRPFKVTTIDQICTFQSLTIFENNLFWLNKECNKIFKIDKFGRNNISAIIKMEVSNSTFLKIYHTNIINNKKAFKVKLNGVSSCKHLTLLHPTGFDCVCPDEEDGEKFDNKTSCDQQEMPLIDPLTCDCTDKNRVCNPLSRYSVCYCSDICVNYTVSTEEPDSYKFHSFIIPDYNTTLSIIPLLLVLSLLGMFIFITYPLNSGIPRDSEK